MSKYELTPLELSALRDCAERGGTRCNDGGMVDTLLSGLCSPKKGGGFALVSWRMNPTSRTDGYISLYEVTQAGRDALAANPL